MRSFNFLKVKDRSFIVSLGNEMLYGQFRSFNTIDDLWGEFCLVVMLWFKDEYRSIINLGFRYTEGTDKDWFCLLFDKFGIVISNKSTFNYLQRDLEYYFIVHKRLFNYIFITWR